MTSSLKLQYTVTQSILRRNKGVVFFWSSDFFTALTVLYSPETIIILHALLPFETAYITRMSTRINESIGQSFSGGSRTPGKAEGLNVARAITTELEISRFDNNLLKQVSKIAASALTMFLSRIDSMVRVYE